MKLHLNATLRAALIAAITAVGVTLPQTYGTVSWNGGKPSGDWFYTDNGKTGSTLLDDEHGQVNITAEGSDPVTAGIAKVTVKDGATVRITGGNFWGQDRTFAALTIDDITAGDGTGSVLLSTQPYAAGKTPANTTATVKAVTGTLSGVQNYGVLTLGVDGSSSFDLTGAIVNNAGTVTLNGTYSFDTSNANNYALRQEGSATWTDVTNKQGFKKTSGSSYYIIKGATAGTGFQATTTTGATVSEESAGTYYFTAGDVTDTTKFYVKAATATLEGVTGTGTFQVDHTGATVTVQDATYRVTTGNMNLNLVINDKGVLETSHSGVNGFITGSLTINAGGIMRIVGEHDAFGWGSKNQCVASLTMKGKEGKLARLELNQSTGNSATMVTDINMQGYSTITSTKQGGSTGFNTFGCKITASGVQNNIDVLDVRRNGVTVDVAQSGELTVQKLTINGSDHSAASVVVKQGKGTLHFTGETKAEGLNIQAGTVDISGTGELHALTIAADGTLTVSGGTTSVSGSTNVIGHVIGLEEGTLSLAGAYDISSLSSSSEPRYIGGDGIGEGSGFKESSGVVQVVNITDGATLTQVEGVSFTYGADSGTLNENGAFVLSGAVDYTTLYVNNTSPVSYTSAWDIAQGQEAEISSVVLADDTTIDADMEGATIALSLTGTTGTVNATETTTIGSVSGWSGNKLIITGEADVSLTPGRDIVIGAGSSLEVDTAVAAQKIQLNGDGANLTVAKDGELSLSNNLTLTNGVADVYGVLNVGHEVDLSNGSKATGELHIYGDGEVTVKDGMWMATSAAGVLLEEGATYAITGKGVSFTGKEGGGSIKAQNAEVNYTTNNANAVISNVTMTATDDITIGNTLSGVDVETGEHGVTLNAAANSVTVGTDGSISFGTSGSTSSITVEDGGTIGSYTKTNEGETTITSVGSAILGDVINLQTGKITMNGEYNIDYLHGDVEITGYEGGAVDGNGFAQETGTVQVVAITDGAELDSSSATFLRGGSELQLTDGAAVVDDVNYAGFYINSGEETLTQAKSEETAHGPLSFIHVKDGATLQVDDDMDGELVYGEGAGTVNIQESMIVTGTMEGVTLAGKGTYDLGSGVSTLGEGTSLGEDWVGIVRISNVTKKDIDLAPFVNGTLSTVELKGFSGWTGSDLWKGLNPQNIKLTNTENGGVAWYSNAFSSYKTDTAVYSGKWSGDGTYVTDVNAARYLNHTYSGDISDWTGVFEKRGDGTSILTFIDNAEEVNVEIKRTAGTLNLVVGNGSDPFDAVFHEEVSVTSVEVKANASATFLGQLTTSTVTNAGSVVFKALSGLTQAITNSGEVIFNEGFEVSGFQVTAGEFGFYDTEGNFSVDGNGYAGTSDSYITIVSGGSVDGKVKVTQDGTDYTMSNDGRALKGDGGVTDEYTFHVNTGTVSTSEIDGGTATSVEVAGGTLDVDQTTNLDITVTGDATVTGEALDVAAIGIEGGATAYFGDKLEMSDGGVEFQAAEGGSVGVYNDGDTKAYDLDNRDMEVSAHSIVKTTGEDATVSNWLYVDKIVNVQDAKLTLDGLGDAVSVKNITVGQEGIVEILDHESGQEATVTVTEELAAGNGTLLANLVFEDNSALLVEGVQKGLSIGSVLTMNTNIQLDEATLRALDNMDIGDTFWLIGAVDGKPMEYTGEYGEEAGYDSVFSRIAYGEGNYTLLGNFNIAFNETDGFGLQRLGSVPEPTTGTLSLLALMALAARRRRKH